jgi:amidohydrolase
VGQTGVIGLLRSDGPGPTLLYRADMDALPIEEKNEVDYRSQKPGAMHACGHDAHLAIALGVAKLIAAERSSLRGNLKLAFQPAEEAGSGALAMIRDGALEGVSAAVGLHIWNDLPAGRVNDGSRYRGPRRTWRHASSDG